jgi:uncharacterized protein
MKKGTFVLFFCLGVFTGSYAQTKKESIKELFHLMRDDSTSTKIMDSIMPMIANKTNQEMDSTTRAKSQEKMKAMISSVSKIIAKVKEDRLNLYDRYFTQDEIKEMIVFYKSPVGHKYIHVKPVIIKEIVMKVMKEYLPEMEKEKKAKQGKEKEED